MTATIRGLLLVTLASVGLAIAGGVHANAPRIPAKRTPTAAQSTGLFVNVKLPAVDAVRLRGVSTEGLARMRAVSGVADRLIMALSARGMRPMVRTELMFPEAIEGGLDRWFTLEVDPAANVEALVAQAKTVAGVEYAESDFTS